MRWNWLDVNLSLSRVFLSLLDRSWAVQLLRTWGSHTVWTAAPLPPCHMLCCWSLPPLLSLYLAPDGTPFSRHPLGTTVPAALPCPLAATGGGWLGRRDRMQLGQLWIWASPLCFAKDIQAQSWGNQEEISLLYVFQCIDQWGSSLKTVLQYRQSVGKLGCIEDRLVRICAPTRRSKFYREMSQPSQW